MGKCDKYRVVQRRAFRFNPLTGTPRPYSYEEGVCLGTKEIDKCDCGGDESRCDFYAEKREAAEEVHCRTCKNFYNLALECRLRNCFRAFSREELESKEFVTDAWESKQE